MTTSDKSIPVLPSRSLHGTIQFYGKLGFSGTLLASATYAILTLEDLKLHFFPHSDLKPAECHAGCYTRIEEVDAVRAAVTPANLPEAGIPRLERVKNKPWNMPESALIDEDGNLGKFGKPL